MRITENMMSSTLLANVNKNREQITQLESQLATGKRVLRPSDDPQASDSILRLQSVLDRNDQYIENIDDGVSAMEETSSALDTFASILQNLKDELISATNGTKQENLDVYATRVDQLLTQAVEVANTKFNGKYIFGGTNTLEQPFTLAADRSAVTANANGITGSIEYEIGDGVTQAVNIDGQEAFNGTAYFQTIIDMRDRLASGQFPAIGDVESVTGMLEHVLGEASKAGSIIQSLETSQTHLEEQQTQVRSLLSLEQDTDVAEATLELKNRELMLEAALKTGASILPKSLLDFLG